MSRAKKNPPFANNLSRWIKRLETLREGPSHDRPGPLDRLESLLQDLHTEISKAGDDAMLRFRGTNDPAASFLHHEEYRWCQLLDRVSTAISAQLEAFEDMLRTYQDAMLMRHHLLEEMAKVAKSYEE